MASSRKTQKQRVREYLEEHQYLSTLEAREKLGAMSIAARIFELKEDGCNVITHWTMAGTKKIARYVLLSSDQKKEVCDEV